MPGRTADILSGMSADRITDVFREIEEPGRSDLRARLDAETRGAVDRLSAYGEETVGSLMTTEFVTVPGSWTVQQTLDHIRRVEKTRETIYAIFVLDPPPFVANCYATAFINDKLDRCLGRGMLYCIIGKIPQRALNHFGIPVHPHRPSRAD